MTATQFQHAVRFRTLRSVTLELAEAGPPGGPLVILLHGFPDVWQGWSRQIPILAEAGYRVLAPNQRGYGRSDKPAGVAAYDLEELALDVQALAASEGRQNYVLIGHDWGGIVAWWTAARFPAEVARLVILNAPHPGIFKTYVWKHPLQLCRSWYVGAFQLPWLPEALLRVNRYGLLARATRSTARPGTFDESDLDQLREAWSQPGALTAMLNYYRAIVRRPESSMRLRVTAPTLILFGQNDPAEEPGLATASQSLCDHSEVVWFETAWHWIQREESDKVNAELRRFLNVPS